MDPRDLDDFFRWLDDTSRRIWELNQQRYAHFTAGEEVKAGAFVSLRDGRVYAAGPTDPPTPDADRLIKQALGEREG